MKNLHKTVSLVVILLSISLSTSGQTVSFGYDASGNRTSRTILVSKTTNLKNADSTEQQQYVDLFSDVKVTISPNPNGGRFKVLLTNLPGSTNSQSPMQLFLHNLSGESIYQIDQLQATNEVDISRYPNGSYVLTILSGTERRTWKVIKQ